MNRHTITKMIVVPSLLAAGAFGAAPVLAEYRCDQPQGIGDQRACAKASEGPEALRRFILRTRMIWDLYYPDYARDSWVAKVPDGTRMESLAVAEGPSAAGAPPQTDHPEARSTQ